MGNEPPPPQNKPQEVQHLEVLVKRARQGDESALPKLLQLLEAVWRCGVASWPWARIGAAGPCHRNAARG